MCGVFFSTFIFSITVNFEDILIFTSKFYTVLSTFANDKPALLLQPVDSVIEAMDNGCILKHSRGGLARLHEKLKCCVVLLAGSTLRPIKEQALYYYYISMINLRDGASGSSTR